MGEADSPSVPAHDLGKELPPGNHFRDMFIALANILGLEDPTVSRIVEELLNPILDARYNDTIIRTDFDHLWQIASMEQRITYIGLTQFAKDFPADYSEKVGIDVPSHLLEWYGCFHFSPNFEEMIKEKLVPL